MSLVLDASLTRSWYFQYLELAQRCSLPQACLDKELSDAGHALGVSMLGRKWNGGTSRAAKVGLVECRIQELRTPSNLT